MTPRPIRESFRNERPVPSGAAAQSYNRNRPEFSRSEHAAQFTPPASRPARAAVPSRPGPPSLRSAGFPQPAIRFFLRSHTDIPQTGHRTPHRLSPQTSPVIVRRDSDIHPTWIGPEEQQMRPASIFYSKIWIISTIFAIFEIRTYPKVCLAVQSNETTKATHPQRTARDVLCTVLGYLWEYW